MKLRTLFFLLTLAACDPRVARIAPGPRPEPLEGFGDVLLELSRTRGTGVEGRLAGDTLYVLVAEQEGLDRTLHVVAPAQRVLAVDRRTGKTTALPELPSWGDGSWALAHEAGTDGVLIFVWTTGGAPSAFFSNGGAWRTVPLAGLAGTLVPQDTWLFDATHVLARTDVGWFAWNGTAWSVVSALGLTADQLGAFGPEGFRVNAVTADQRQFCSTLFGWEGQQVSRDCLSPPLPGRWTQPAGSQQGTASDFIVALDLVSDARVCGGTDGLVYRFERGTWTAQTGDGMPRMHVVSSPGTTDAWLEANPQNWEMPELRQVKDGAVTLVAGTFPLVGGTCDVCTGHSFTTRPQTWIRGGELLRLWQEDFEVQRVLRLLHTPLPWRSPGFASRACGVYGLNCEAVFMRCEIGEGGFAACFQRKEVIDPTPALHAAAVLPDPTTSSTDGLSLTFEVLDGGRIHASTQTGTTVEAEVDPGDYRLTAAWDAGSDLPPVTAQSAATHVEMCQAQAAELPVALSFGQRVGPALGEPVFAHDRASGTTLLRGGAEVFGVRAVDEHHVALTPLGDAEGFASFSSRGGLVAFRQPGSGTALVDLATGARLTLGVTDDVRTFQLSEQSRRALVPRSTTELELWSWPAAGLQSATRDAVLPVDARLSPDGRFVAWGGSPLSRTDLDTNTTVAGPTVPSARSVHAVTDAGRVVVRQVNGAGFLYFVERWDGAAWVRDQLPEYAFNVGVASGDTVFWLEKASANATTATLKVQRGATAAAPVTDGASPVTTRVVLSDPTWPNTSEQGWVLWQEDRLLLSLAATNHLAVVDLSAGQVTQRVTRPVANLDQDCSVMPCVTHWFHGVPAVLEQLPVGGVRPGVRVVDDTMKLTLVGGGRAGADLVVMRRSTGFDYQAVPVQPGMPCAPYTRTVRSRDVPDTFVTELLCVR